MMKIFFFTSLILCLVLAPLSSQAGQARDMAAGTWTANPRYMTFGGLLWRVLEVKDDDSDFDGVKTAFLLLDDLLRDDGDNVIFTRFAPRNNSFPNSAIKAWLNDGANGFLAGLGAYQADILDTTYGPDNAPRRWAGGVTSGTSKIFLLSVGEAGNDGYFADDADRAAGHSGWWLRSPGFEENIATVVIHTGFVARNGMFVDNRSAIRPAMKIDLSPSSVFASVTVSYRLAVNVNNGGGPIPGAKVSLAPSPPTRGAENFSNSTGVARFVNVASGTHTVTVSRPGYITESRLIAVPAEANTAISLAPDPAALPDRVKFGKYGGNPIEWNVLDIEGGKALLLAGALFQGQFDIQGSNLWEDSSLRAHLNSDAGRGFLQASNFTAAETAAISTAPSPTGDSVFLLSSGEVFHYLPDADMRRSGDVEWLTRSPFGDEDVIAIGAGGERGIVEVFALTRSPIWVRPAVWVDLSMLTYDSGTNTLAGLMPD